MAYRGWTPRGRRERGADVLRARAPGVAHTIDASERQGRLGLRSVSQASEQTRRVACAMSDLIGFRHVCNNTPLSRHVIELPYDCRLCIVNVFIQDLTLDSGPLNS